MSHDDLEPGVIIKLRRDSTINWATDNPVLAVGETGWDTDLLKVKLGDGVTAWNDLPYAIDGPEGEVDTVAGVSPVLGDIPVGALKTALDLPDNSVITVGFDDSADFQVSDFPTPNACITAALAALPAAGGSVLFKAGTYNFTAGVSVPAYTKLIGEGQNSVIRWATGAAPADGTYLFTLDDFSEVSSLRFDGNSGTNGNGGGIYLFEAARVWLDRLYIASFGKDGIRLNGTDSSNSSHANKFTNLYIRDCDRYGIYGEGSFTYDSQFDNVWIGVCNVGLKMDSGDGFASNLHVWGCVSDGIQGAQNIKFGTVYSESNGGWGINATGSLGGLSIAGGNIWQNGTGGILLGAGTDRSALSALVVRENVGPGIEIQSSFCTVTGCTFFDLQGTKTQTRPVIITGTAASNLVSDCVGRGSDHLTGTFSSTSSALSNVFENCIGLNPRGFSSLGNRDGSATVTFDRRDAETFYATLTGNWGTVVMPATAGLGRGMAMTLVLTQDATGGRTITWPSNFKKAGDSLVIDPTPNITTTIGMVLDSAGDWQEVSRSIGNNSTTTPVGGRRTSVLSGNTPFTNNTLATLCSVAVAAGQTWRVSGMVVVDGGQAGDCKLRLQATSATGATGWFAVSMQAAGSSTSTTAVSGAPVTAVAVAVSGGSTLAFGTVGVGSMQAVHFDGYVTVSSTAGTLDLQAAQVTTDATALTVYAGTFLEAVRVS